MNGSAIKDDKLILWGMKATPWVLRFTILNHDKTKNIYGKIAGIIPLRGRRPEPLTFLTSAFLTSAVGVQQVLCVGGFPGMVDSALRSSAF